MKNCQLETPVEMWQKIRSFMPHFLCFLLAETNKFPCFRNYQTRRISRSRNTERYSIFLGSHLVYISHSISVLSGTANHAGPCPLTTNNGSSSCLSPTVTFTRTRPILKNVCITGSVITPFTVKMQLSGQCK